MGQNIAAHFVIIVQWLSVVKPTIDDLTTKFVAVQPGQIPVTGIWPLATASTDSIIKCAKRCVRSGDIAGCVAFVYRPDVCEGKNSLLAKPGSCDFFIYFDLTALSYGPASSSCDRFYVSSAVNLAIGKPATQVSTYSTKGASKAVDGDMQSSSSTADFVNPWWSVNLLQSFMIGEVDVVNYNSNAFAYRLNNFFVKLTNVKPTAGKQISGNYDLCGQYKGALKALGIGKVVCSTNIQPNRYVIVQGSLTYSAAMSLTEVTVYLADE